MPQFAPRKNTRPVINNCNALSTIRRRGFGTVHLKNSRPTCSVHKAGGDKIIPQIALSEARACLDSASAGWVSVFAATRIDAVYISVSNGAPMRGS